MAIPEIIAVPAKTGMAPKAPEEPIWSERMDICGLQFRPNKNSFTGIILKKRIASKSTDNTMPIVVKMAKDAQATRKKVKIFSTWFLALRIGVILCLAINAPIRAKDKITTVKAAFPVACNVR